MVRWKLRSSFSSNVDKRYKKRIKSWKSSSFSQPSGSQQLQGRSGVILYFFGSGLVNADCDWHKIYFKKRDGFFFRSRDSSPLHSTICRFQQKSQCWLLFPKWNIIEPTAGFALFTIVETRSFIGWNVKALFSSTCWTKHISNNLLNFAIDIQFIFSSFLYLVDWIGTLKSLCLSVNKFIIFLAKIKCVVSVFVVFTSSCNVKGTL